MAADPAAGRLVRPFKHALKAASSFYVVHPPEAICQRKVRIFRDSLFQRSISSSQSRRLAGSVRILASSQNERACSYVCPPRARRDAASAESKTTHRLFYRTLIPKVFHWMSRLRNQLAAARAWLADR